jgi:hypothetical protein
VGRTAADLTTRTFGRLRPDRRVGADAKGNALWVCRCDPELGGCGTTTAPLRADALRSGNVQSCGCLRGDHARTQEFRAAQSRRGKAAARKMMATAGWLDRNRRVWPKTCETCRRPFVGTARQRYCRRQCWPSLARSRAICFRRPMHRKMESHP